MWFTFRKETAQIFGFKKKRRYHLWLSKFSQQHLSLHFSALWSWVWVGTLPHTCSTVKAVWESRQNEEEGHDESEDGCLPLCWSHVTLSLHPTVFPLCLKRPKEKHAGQVRYWRTTNSRTTQVDNHRSYSELCPYVCDIRCTCMYFKS